MLLLGDKGDDDDDDDDDDEDNSATALKSQDRQKWLLPDSSTGDLVVSKAYPSTLFSAFLTGFRYFSYQVATQLASRLDKGRNDLEFGMTVGMMF